MTELGPAAGMDTAIRSDCSGESHRHVRRVPAPAPRDRSPAGLAPTAAIPPGGWLGVLGGGQLGRMFCIAARNLGYNVAVLEPGIDAPAADFANRRMQADYLDRESLAAMAACVSGATTEFENVPAAALDYLARTGRVMPGAASVAIAQDRMREKAFLAAHGFAVAPYAVLGTGSDPRRVDPRLLPGIVKRASLGYDGKGQIRVHTLADVESAFAAFDRQPCVLEQHVLLEREFSVVVARNEHGEIATWPVIENQHRHGILDVSIAPARLGPMLARQIRDVASRVAAALDYRGVMCVEFFLTRAGDLLVNEVAPRPHNSGHFTIDACMTSQFEQQVRVLAGLPLGDTHQHTPAVMVNLLGDIWFAGDGPHEVRDPPWAAVLRNPRAKLHLYGKAQPRSGRKMGHVTCLGATLEQALEAAREVKRALGIPAPEIV